MNFEWDNDKAQKNLIKHGITFELATKVFGDEYRIDYFDSLHSEYEDRYITIGKVKDVLFVVYTMRVEKIRIISARKATVKERRAYYGYDREKI